MRILGLMGNAHIHYTVKLGEDRKEVMPLSGHRAWRRESPSCKARLMAIIP